MNYFPYFRGKQYELICLRENSELIANQGFTPVIEPVKENPSGLVRALLALRSSGSKCLVVANPSVGHHAQSLSDAVVKEVREALNGFDGGGWIYQIKEAGDLVDLRGWLRDFPAISLLHHGSGEVSPKQVQDVLDELGAAPAVQIFTESCSTRYRAAFESENKVLLSDGFKKKKNADYPPVELFSELPITYLEYRVSGFGDYLIVGSEYSEGGGAAYAVAIHITYKNPDDGNAIYIRHFISDSNDSPVDPAGKFREALGKLVESCDSRDSRIPETDAIKEFRKLHASGHFPGLGYVKKLSMQHHLEMMGS